MGLRMLLIDSHHETAQFYHVLLSQGLGADFDIVDAEDVQQGLEICSSKLPHCVVLHDKCVFSVY